MHAAKVYKPTSKTHDPSPIQEKTTKWTLNGIPGL